MGKPVSAFRLRVRPIALGDEMTRYAKRVDDNQKVIVAAFRKLGAWVFDLSSVGRGMADLLIVVGPAHAIAMVEIKDGAKAKSRRALTPAQQKLHDDCPAHVWVVEGLEDVATVVRYYRLG